MGMNRALATALCTGCLVVLTSRVATAEDAKAPAAAVAVQDRQRVEWREDFETQDPVEFWVTRSNYDVAFKGVTDEMAVSGKKAFKLDVTFKEGGYYYWCIPVRFPAEGSLKFSAKVLLGKETTGSAGLGVNIVLPPTQHTGCGDFLDLATTNGEWRTVAGDVVARAEETAGGVSSSQMAFVTGADVGRVMDRIGIFLRGGAGKRVVLYLDDVRLDCEVPAEPAYQQTVQKRWAAAQERMKEPFAAHRKGATETREKFKAMQGVAPSLVTIVAALDERLSGLEAKLTAAEARGYMNRDEHADLAEGFRVLVAAADSLKDVGAQGIAFQDILPSVLDNPMIRTPILPTDKLLPGKLAAAEIRMAAAKGEYESASVVVQALNIEAGDLRHDSGDATIPADEIDIHAVKCWYQAGTAWTGIAQSKTIRKLTPELLLKDDGLVRVDTAEEKNYLRLNFPDGVKDVWVSNPDADTKGCKIWQPQECPVRDAKQLLPLDLPANTNKQYWITVRVPDDAVDGFYTATLKISGNGAELGKIVLWLRVLPFALPSPKTYYDTTKDFISSVYYRGVLGGPKRKDAGAGGYGGGAGWLYPDGSVSSEYKNEIQLRAELQDMVSHNILNPTSYQGFGSLGTYLRIRNELGMNGLPLLSLGVGTGSPKGEAELKSLQERVKALRAVARSYGVEEVYVYGIDEAQGEALIAQREAWKTVHEAGGKVFVAGYKGHFEKIGDLLDVQVQAGMPVLDEARKWHSANHRVFCYANPQTGPENPEEFRRNFGLLLWKAEYDGAMTYAYQHSFGDIYNDFDDVTYRDHVFSYPTVDGVIATLAIEGYREAIDDIRYGTLLKTCIAHRKAAGGANAELAVAAEKYLDTLGPDRDLETVRLEMIDMILNLMPEK